MNVRVDKLAPSAALALFDEEINRRTPRVARAFRRYFEDVRNRANAQQLAELIQRNDVAGIERLLGGSMGRVATQDLRDVISRVVAAGARKAGENIGPVRTLQGEELVIGTEGLNPRLADFAQQLTATRIRELDQQTRDLVRTIVREGSVAGQDPYAIARRIRGSIGLTARQERAIDNYRRNLSTLDPYALQRELRDRRSDRPVARAIENGQRLSPQQIESLVDRYRQRWVQYRSQVIGRTETIRAVQGAQHELIQSYIDNGSIDARQVVREWIVTPDARLRDAHAAIPQMNENGVGQDEPFRSPLGPIMYPGDPAAPAANVIQCRCAVFVEIVDPELVGLVDGEAGSSPPPVSRPPELPVTEPSGAGRRVVPERFRNIPEAERWAVDNGIAAEAQLKGLDRDNVRLLMLAAADVYDRFDIPRLRAVGPLSRFPDAARRYRRPSRANAAIAPDVAGPDGSRGVFHAPTKFGQDFERQRVTKDVVAKLNRAGTYEALRRERLTELANNGQIDDGIFPRIEQMREDGKIYTWTLTDPEDTAEDQIRKTTYHEFGHVLHLVDQGEIRADINAFLSRVRPRASGWDLLVSKYGGSNDAEYIAETFAIYMTRPQAEHYRIHPELLEIYRKHDRSFPT